MAKWLNGQRLLIFKQFTSPPLYLLTPPFPSTYSSDNAVFSLSTITRPLLRSEWVNDKSHKHDSRCMKLKVYNTRAELSGILSSLIKKLHILHEKNAKIIFKLAQWTFERFWLCFSIANLGMAVWNHNYYQVFFLCLPRLVRYLNETCWRISRSGEDSC